MKLNLLPAAILLSLSISNVAGAAVINSADVNGLRTFQDTNTHRIWLDMDNFFSAAGGQTGVQMIAAAQAAGFTVANKTDVTALLSDVAVGANFPTVASIMGSGVPRGLIWGMYDDGPATARYGWAFNFSVVDYWQYNDNIYSPATMVNSGDPSQQDMGIFAFRAGAPTNVPEPGGIALMGLGIAGLLAARRRKAKA